MIDPRKRGMGIAQKRTSKKSRQTYRVLLGTLGADVKASDPTDAIKRARKVMSGDWPSHWTMIHEKPAAAFTVLVLS